MVTAAQQMDGMASFMEYLAAGPFYYYPGWDRCDPIHSGYADCSGSVVASMRHVGIEVICTGSFQLAIWCHQQGLGLSFEEAINTRGSLFFKGIHEGQGGIPGEDPGHVAMGVGHSRLVVEARNRAAGILLGPGDWRGWDYCARPPFLSKSRTPIIRPRPRPKPQARKREHVIIHDALHPGLDADHPRIVDIDPTNNGMIFLGNGAALQTAKSAQLGNLTVVNPGYVPGEEYKGAYPDKDGGGFTMMSLQKNGQWGTRHYRFRA